MSPLHYPPPVRVLPNSFLSPNFPHHVTSSSSPVLQPLTSSPSRLPGIGYLIHLKACRRCFLNPSPSRCENCITKKMYQYTIYPSPIQFYYTTLLSSASLPLVAIFPTKLVPSRSWNLFIRARVRVASSCMCGAWPQETGHCRTSSGHYMDKLNRFPATKLIVFHITDTDQ